MIEQIQFAKLFGVAHIDNLLQEMLLGGKYRNFLKPYLQTILVLLLLNPFGNLNAFLYVKKSALKLSQFFSLHRYISKFVKFPDRTELQN